jgi:hypothetical protein
MPWPMLISFNDQFLEEKKLVLTGKEETLYKKLNNYKIICMIICTGMYTVTGISYVRLTASFLFYLPVPVLVFMCQNQFAHRILINCKSVPVCSSTVPAIFNLSVV